MLRLRSLALVLALATLEAHSLAAQEPPEARFGVPLRTLEPLEEPSAVAFAADGRILVLEAAGDQLALFERTGERVASFGSAGSGPGQFLGARGLAVAPDGRWFVADTGNHRIEVFAPDGTFERAFGAFGSGAGELNAPQGLDVDRERVAVADTRNDRIQIFDLQGNPRATLGRSGTGAGELDHPLDVAFDADGRVFVADGDHHRIQVFARDGNALASWGDFGPHPGLFATPSGIEHRAGRIYVADRDNHRVQVFDTNGKRIYEWGVHALRPHEGEGKLHYPSQIAIAPDGSLALVCEGFENRCQIFGLAEPGAPPLETPLSDRQVASHFGPSITVAGDLLALTEPAVPAVLLYDADPPDEGGGSAGEPVNIAKLSSSGQKSGQLARPSGIALDPSEPLLWIADSSLARLSSFRIQRESGAALRFDPRMLAFVRSLDFTALAADEDLGLLSTIEPVAVAVHPSGELYVVDARNRRVVVLTRKLAIRRTLGGNRLIEPTAVSFSRSGEVVFAVDQLARKVRALSLEGAELFAWSGASESEPFVRPFGVTSGRDGFVYVSDEAQSRISKFDESGRFVASFGRSGLGAVEFYKPRGLTQDERGRLIVLDWGNHRGQILTSDGVFVDAFGSRLFTRPAKAR